jgi:hypothetical protein
MCTLGLTFCLFVYLFVTLNNNSPQINSNNNSEDPATRLQMKAAYIVASLMLFILLPLHENKHRSCPFPPNLILFCQNHIHHNFECCKCIYESIFQLLFTYTTNFKWRNIIIIIIIISMPSFIKSLDNISIDLLLSVRLWQLVANWHHFTKAILEEINNESVFEL